ncbi:MAG: hypothetical protein ACRD15_09745 [Vicinamibacterales bacterium]
MAAAAAAGGVLALMAVALFDPQGGLAHMDVVTATVGVLAGIGLDRFLRG